MGGFRSSGPQADGGLDVNRVLCNIGVKSWQEARELRGQKSLPPEVFWSGKWHVDRHPTRRLWAPSNLRGYHPYLDRRCMHRFLQWRHRTSVSLRLRTPRDSRFLLHQEPTGTHLPQRKRPRLSQLLPRYLTNLNLADSLFHDPNGIQ
jgi:hypothetical protein